MCLRRGTEVLRIFFSLKSMRMSCKPRIAPSSLLFFLDAFSGLGSLAVFVWNLREFMAGVMRARQDVDRDNLKRRYMMGFARSRTTLTDITKQTTLKTRH